MSSIASSSVKMSAKNGKKLNRKASFKAKRSGGVSMPHFQNGNNNRKSSRNWDIYPASHSVPNTTLAVVPQNPRLVMGYFSSCSSAGGTFCDDCSQCSNEYQENQPWPRRPSAATVRSNRRPRMSRKNQRPNSNNSRYIASTTTMTTTKTLVSLKSCRSLSEIETLPPSGYFASTVVRSTYVNDDFVSDCEEEKILNENNCCGGGANNCSAGKER